MLVSAFDGEHASAHLADFESARQQRTDGTRIATTTSTGGGAFYTDLYVAPEILAVAAAKPTHAADMFSYGVCCLFACCLPAEEAEQPAKLQRFVDDGRQLAPWSRDEARDADAHLPSLLDKLLTPATTHEEALDRRWDARQTLLHPFLDTFEAIELARRETEAAALARLAQQLDGEEERRRLEAEADAQRQAIEQERRRHQELMQHVQAEQEADAARREEELRRERRANETEGRRLQAQRETVERQQAAAAAAEARAREQRERLRTKQAEINAAEAALQRQEAGAQARLTTLRSEEQQLQRGVRTARDEHGRTTQQLDRVKRELVERETSDLRRQPMGLQKQQLRPHGGDVAEYLAVVDRVEKYVQSDHNNPIRAPRPYPPPTHPLTQGRHG